MGALSHTLGAELDNMIFINRIPAKHTHLYIGLYKSSPARSGGGIEVTGGGYQRIAVAAGSTNWEYSPTSPGVRNRKKIQFANPTAAWGTITHFGVFSAATGDNMLLFGQLSSPITVNNGDGAVKFDPNSISITLGG